MVVAEGALQPIPKNGVICQPRSCRSKLARLSRPRSYFCALRAPAAASRCAELLTCSSCGSRRIWASGQVYRDGFIGGRAKARGGGMVPIGLLGPADIAD